MSAGMIESNDHRYHIPSFVDPTPWRWVVVAYKPRIEKKVRNGKGKKPTIYSFAPETVLVAQAATLTAAMKEMYAERESLKAEGFTEWELKHERVKTKNSQPG